MIFSAAPEAPIADHMAKRAVSKKKTAAKGKTRKKARKPIRPFRWVVKWAFRATAVLALITLALIALFAVINPPTTHTMWSESRRLGGIDQDWVSFEDIAPVMARSVVAAEDANFCAHWGLDVTAIRAALEDGSGRGGSTISQQVVKNVYLWQERSWFRKSLEAAITPAVEAIWSKRRIIEVYLNVAEFDEGVFGIKAASWHYFGVGPGDLTPVQASRLAVVLPSPKTRSASNPSPTLRTRAARIRDGAATIRADGRAACFED